MRKAALILAGVLAVLVLVVAIGPRLVGLNSLKPRLTEAVQEATGRELAIAGDITLAVLPGISFGVSDVTLANPPGASAPHMAAVGSVEGELALLPLLTGEVVVERLVIREPVVALEVDEKGQPNWALSPAGEAAAGGGESTAPETDGAPPQVAVEELRIEGGRLSYRDAVSGQEITAEALAVALALPGMDRALRAEGSTRLNGQDVDLKLSFDSPAAALGGARADLTVEITSALTSLDYDGSVQQEPVPGLAGALNLYVKSLGEAAAWLGQPLPPGQPDPGAITLSARFSTDQGKAALESAEIKGDDLLINASGSFDGSGDVKQAVLRLESGHLDVDRYLPAAAAPAADEASPPAAESPQAGASEGPQSLLALIPDEPFDLQALRGLNADISLSLEGLKAAGYETGPIGITGLLQDGLLTAQLEELALYGGALSGQATLDASGAALDANASLRLESIDLGALAGVAVEGPAPVAGALSGSLQARGQGTSPRALAAALQARLDLDLGAVEVADPAAAGLSELKLAFEVPEPGAGATLTGTLVYQEKPVSLVLETAPLTTVLAGEAFDLKAELVSALVTAGYLGQVQQNPLPGLDGKLALDIGSVAELAAWLGQPLDAAQPDPGPLKLTADFAADQGKVALERAVIEGEALNATLRGSFDGTGDVKRIDLTLESGLLDVDRYLPAPQPAPAPAAADAPAEPEGAAQGGDLLALLSDQPLDLSLLRDTEARVTVAIAGIKAAGYEVGRLALGAKLEGGVLDAEVEEVALYGGKIAGSLRLDGAGQALAAETEITVQDLDMGALTRAGTGDPAPLGGMADGALRAKAAGASPRALAEALSASLDLTLGSLDLADAGAADLSGLTLALDLPGMETASRLTGSAVYKQETVALSLDLAPLKTILAGESFDLKAEVASALLSAGYEGRVQQQPLPGLDGDLKVETSSLGALAAWLGQPLEAGQPDPGPLALTASFAADQGKVMLERAEISGDAMQVTASGTFEAGEAGTSITLALDSGQLDIDRYLPPPAAAPEAPMEAEAAAPAETAGPPDLLALLPDEALDLTPLRETEADISVTLAGLKAAGYEVGRVALSAVLTGGKLAAEVTEAAVYGGQVTGRLSLDASGDSLAAETDLAVAAVDLGDLAKVAAGDAAPVAGRVTGALRAAAAGASPRALAEALSAQLDLDLSGLEIADPAAADLAGLKLAVTLPGVDAASDLTGSLVYKDRPVNFALALAPLTTILAGEAFDLKLDVTSVLLSAGYQGRVRQQPLPGLDGDLDLDVRSVGELAAWLGQPLDAAQPDPGPLKLSASFAADPEKVAIDRLALEGTALSLSANGGLEAGGEVTKVALEVESGVLDIDRYLPPPQPAPEAPAVAAAEDADEAEGPTDLLALLPDEPLDLSALRGADADVTIKLAGIKASGFEVGPLTLVGTLADGVLDARLQELALYEGRVAGSVRLDGSGAALGARTDLTVDRVDMGALARAAAGEGTPAVGGMASGRLQAQASGASPRALAESLSATLAFDLGNLEVADPAAADLSGLEVALDLPGLAAPSRLTGAAVYRQERVELALDLAPLKTILAGEAFDLKAEIASALVTAGYEGRVQQRPLPGLDGELAVDIASVGELAAWLGQPLDEAQPDPGPLALSASFAADQGKIAIERAEIAGEALAATASGSIEPGDEVTRIALKLESDVLDIDRYLPAPNGAPVEAAPQSAPESPEAQGTTDLLALLSDEPLDLSALRTTEAEVEITVRGIKAVGYEVGRVDLVAGLAGGKLQADLRELALYDGRVTGVVRLDAAGQGLAADTEVAVDGVDVGALARVATGGDAPVGGRASGRLHAAARGASPRALAEALSAGLKLDLGGLELDDPAAADISGLALAVDLPGLDDPSKMTGDVTYKGRPVSVALDLAPLKTILAGEAFDLTAEVVSELVSAGYRGQVQMQPVPGLDGDLKLDIGSVGTLADWLGQPLDPAQPDPGPLKLSARFAADRGKVALQLAEIEGEALKASARGSVEISGDRRKITLKLDSEQLDIDRYLPPPAADEAPPAAPDEAAAEAPAGPPDLLALLPDAPLDLSALRDTDADITVSLGGLKAAGYEIGRTVLALALQDAVLDAELRELALYGGQVAGTVKLDGATADLDVATDLTVSSVDVGALARAAMGEDAPVGGVASGSLQLAAAGASPRALAEALSAQLALDLGGVDLTDPAAAELSELQLALDLPGLAAPSTLAGSAVYKRERVDVTLGLAPLRTILSGDPFALSAQVVSALVTAGYDGEVQQQPLPGLDGRLNVSIGSVGKLADWLGQPLDPAQPDPGALKLTAAFAADQGKVAIERAEIQGDGLMATASGAVDTSGEVTMVALEVESGALDLDRYLPAPAAAPAAEAPATAQAEAPPQDLLALLSDEPIDLSALHGTEADVSLTVGGLKAAGYELGRTVLAVLLKDGVLTTELREMALYGGGLSGSAVLDGAGEALGVTTDLTLARVDLGRLALAATGEPAAVGGLASGRLQAEAAGASPRALAEALSAKLSLDLGEIEAADPAAADLSGLKLAFDLPGLAAPAKLDGSVVYKEQPVTFDLGLAPLKTILAGEAFDLDLKVDSALLGAGYAGKVMMQPGPGLDGALDLNVGSLGELAAWLGVALDPSQPDPGPLGVSFKFAGDAGKVTLKEGVIRGNALEATVNGSFDGRGEVPKIILDVDGGVLDLDSLLPAPAAAEPAPPEGEAAPSGDITGGLSDEPLDLSALKLADLDLKLSLDGLKASGYELGAIALDSRLAGGILNATLGQLALYGGGVSGKTTLDASGAAAAVATDLALDRVDIGALGEAATGAPPPASGRVSGTVSLQAAGASPKALAEALKAKLALQLAGLTVEGAPDAGASDLAVDADLPGLDAPSKVSLAGTYKDEQVSADLSLDPIKRILAGETFALTAEVVSQLVTASYKGRVQQQPLPGLDGDLAVAVGSVGKLAAWLGTPLDPAQPDPGPLSVKAKFAADEGAVALEAATIEGRAANARASGRFDTTAALTRFDGTVVVDQLDLDAYLPPQETAAAQGGGGQAPADPGWSTAPLDLQALRTAEGKVLVELASARYRGLDLRDGRITLDLTKGVLNARIERLGLAEGTVRAATTLDATGKAAGLAYRVEISGVQARPVLRAFADSDRLSGKLQFETTGQAVGASQKQLVQGLNGNGQFAFLDGAIHGVNIAQVLRQAGSLGLGDSVEKKTDFSELSGSFTIVNGLLNNQDLKMLAPLVRLTGAGDVPLPPQMVDYTAEAKLVASLEGQGGDQSLTGLPIPISITGPWSNPSYGVDWERVFLEAATDPSRIANMPDSLRDAAKGFGVDLPIPGIPGAEGAAGVGAVLEAIPGVGGDKEGGGVTEGVTGALKGLLNPGGGQEAPDPAGQGAAVPSGPTPSGPTPSAPAPSGSTAAAPAPSGPAPTPSPSPSGALKQLLSPAPSGGAQQEDTGGEEKEVVPGAKKLLKGLFGN